MNLDEMVAHVAYMGRRKYIQDFVGILQKEITWKT